MRYGSSLMLVMIFAFGSCKNTKSTTTLTDHANCTPNSSSTYSLCINTVESKKGNSVPYTEYQLIDEASNVVMEGTLDNGSAKWISDDAIEIVNVPGNINEEMDMDDFSRVYLISTGKSISKKEYLKIKN